MNNRSPENWNPIMRNTAFGLGALLVSLDDTFAAPNTLVMLGRIDNGQRNILHDFHQTGHFVPFELAFLRDEMDGCRFGQLPFGIELAIGSRKFLAQSNGKAVLFLQAKKQLGALNTTKPKYLSFYT